MDVFGFCKYREKTTFVHAIAGKMPEEPTKRAKKRKKDSLKKTPRNSKPYIVLCWVGVITSLVEDTVAEKSCTCTEAAGRWNFCLNVLNRIFLLLL